MILYQCQYCTWYLISLQAFVHNLSSILPFCPPPSPHPFILTMIHYASMFLWIPNQVLFTSLKLLKLRHSFLFLLNLYYALMFVQMTNRVLTVWCLLFYITLSRSLMFLDLQLWALRQSFIGAGKIQVSYMKKHVSQGRLRRRLCVL